MSFYQQFPERFLNASVVQCIQLLILSICLISIERVAGSKLRSSVQYGLWTLILLKTLCPPTLSSPTGIAYWLPTSFTPHAIVDYQSQTPTRMETQSIPSGNENWEKSMTNNIAIEEPSAVSLTKGGNALELSIKSAIFLLYGLGLLGFTFYYFDRYRLLKRSLSESTIAPVEVEKRMKILTYEMGLKKNIRLLISPHTTSPSVRGVLRPTVYLPSVLEDQLTPHSLDLVLRHELYHIKRGDLWMNYLQAVIHILNFYNPIIWFANMKINKLREEATDEAVLSHKEITVKDYSHTLVNTAELTLEPPVPQTFALCVTESKTKLEDRIEKMLKRSRPSSSKLGWTGWSLILLFALLLIPMAPYSVKAKIAANSDQFKLTQSEAIIEKIENKVQEIFDTVNQADNTAYLSHFSENASELHPGRSAIIGIDEVKRAVFNRPMAGVKFVRVKYGDRMIWDCGNRVIELGNIDLFFTVPNNPDVLTDKRQYLTIWTNENEKPLQVGLLSWNPRMNDKLANHFEKPKVFEVNPILSNELKPINEHSEIESMENAYNQTFKDQDFDKTLSCLSSDSIQIPSDNGILFGKEQIRDYYTQQELKGKLIKIERQTAKIEGNENLLIVVNIFKWHFQNAESQETKVFHGKGVHVWKKSNMEKWELFLDIYNSNS